jgi:hypothetical protein
MKLKLALSQINPELVTSKIQSGNLVITDQGHFYIAISAGQFKIEDANYFAISPVSPIGLRLIGLKSGDQFSFNNKVYQIENVL